MMGHPYGTSTQREIFQAERSKRFLRRALWVAGAVNLVVWLAVFWVYP